VATRDISNYNLNINALGFLSCIGLHSDRFLKLSHSDQVIRGL